MKSQLKNIVPIALLLGASISFQCKNAVEAAIESPASSRGNIVFFDDFTQNVLDTNKWNREITGNHFNNELQAYTDSSVTLYTAKGGDAEGANNGVLVFQPKYAPGFVTKDGQQFDFLSSRITTQHKFDFTYGTAEARIKLTDGAGLWPAWWMLGNGMWPETGEIDIMEYIGEKDWASAAVHGPKYSGDAALVDRLYFADSNDVTHWHVYGVDWTPDSLVFKYDGVPMFRVTKPMTQFFGGWAFDSPKFLILNFAVGGIYPYKINGIKEPYYGLPASTFEAIKKGEGKMLVDWVKVSKKSI